MAEARVPLEASRARIAAGHRGAGAPDPTARMEVTILVRRRPQALQLDASSLAEAPRLSRAQAAVALGADPADLGRAASFAESYDLTVLEASAARRAVRVSGTVPQMEAAFGVTLETCEAEGRRYICYDGVLSIPASLDGIIVAVLGLDQRPVARRSG